MQACVAPLEFAVMIYLILRWGGLTYVSIAYACWCVIEIGMFYVNYKLGAIPKDREKHYIALVALVMVIMIWGIVVKGQMLFINYFDALVGVWFWARYIRREEYPMKPLAGAAFLTKFVADVCLPGLFPQWDLGH